MRFAVMALALAMTAVLGSQRCVAAPPTFAGPFDVRQCLVLHIVNPSGNAFTLHLRWREPDRAQTDRPLLVRVFDPDETLLIRHDAPGERSEQIEQSVSLQVPARGPGVYQIAITGFRPTVDVRTDPPLSFGVYGAPSLACRVDQFADAWVYMPRGLNWISVRGGEGLQSLTLLDQGGAARLNLSGATQSATTVQLEDDRMYRVSARAAGVGTVNFSSLPIILCPDQASAQAIHGSVDVLDDGTVCFHKFQVRAHALLKRFRAMPPSAFAVPPFVLVRSKPAWLADPVRNQFLVGPYGVFSALDVVLNEQVLDGASPWFGCIYNWRDEAGRLRAANPWTTYDRLGMKRAASSIGVLAAVVSVREPFNPLFGNEALRNRIAIAALQELMLMREHEHVLPEIEEYQGGDRAFTLANLTNAFALAKGQCPDDAWAVWREGLGRMVDHHAVVAEVCLTVNQWTFLIRSLQQFADGSGDAWYGEIVQRHLRQLRDRIYYDRGQSRAGYFAESEGPDATYAGLELHNLACVYEQTRDNSLLEMIRRSLDLYNHTLAPEPDGTYVGASSFCHRTPLDFTHLQGSGGLGMLADDLPEAAAHAGRSWLAPPIPHDAQQFQAAEQRLTSMLMSLDRRAFTQPAIGEGAIAGGPELHFQIWRHFASQPLAGALPAVDSQRFDRNFGDEFLCVRRPSYYAFLFAGAPMGTWQQSRRPADSSQQHPRNGGGLCMFWSPAFGSSILAHNWSATAAQTLLIERRDGAGFDWEDYWSIERAFDAEHAKAIIRGSIMNQPLTFERRYEFLDEGVKCEVTLRAGKSSESKGSWECFPYSLQKSPVMSVRFLDAAGRPARDGLASVVVFASSASEVHVLVFDQPRECRDSRDQGLDYQGKQHEHARVLARVGTGLKAGDAVTARWMLTASPSSADAVRGAITRALQALRAR